MTRLFPSCGPGQILQTRSGPRKKEPRPFQWQKAGPEALEDLPFRLRNCPLWNEVLPNGRTFLSCAVEYEGGEIVKLLRDLEADPDIRNTAEHQMTPLIKALKIGNMAMVDLLKRKDRHSMHILVDEADDMGEEQVLELARKLLGQGYDLSKRNPKGQNPVHIACHKGRKQFVEQILHPKYEKAFIHYADNSGKTPLQYAIDKEDIVKLLLEDGAEISEVPTATLFKLNRPKSPLRSVPFFTHRR